MLDAGSRILSEFAFDVRKLASGVPKRRRSAARVTLLQLIRLDEGYAG